MKKNLILCLIFISIIILYYNNRYKIQCFTNVSEIPKIIWTFWDTEELPPIVIKCIDTWTKYNPNYKINKLNKNNLKEYLPDVDFTKIKHLDSHARFSDMVRLYILSRYGGIWSDASIICTKPFDSWIPELQEKNNSDFIGFYLESFTLPEYKETAPVIESWFFGCSENSLLVRDWLNEFIRISDYNTINDYVESIKQEGVNIQNINIPDYLTIHVSLQKILQKGPNKPYSVGLLKAEDTAYKYLIDEKWDTIKAINNLLDCENIKQEVKCDFLNSPIIKLRGSEREEADKQSIKKV